ncbi:MAG: hypothetical protein ACE5JQ_07260 [Candidatus Methylomirabilales bacterium]
MRNWGIIITLFYFIVVTILLLPGAYVISGGHWHDVVPAYKDWLTWLWIGILVSGQAILLFISVDSSRKKLKPRQHVLVSVSTVALMFGLLTYAGLFSLLGGIFGDPIMVELMDTRLQAAGWLIAFWLFWALVFSLYQSEISSRINLLVRWLIKGSVLELLIAVPSHIIARHRNDCSAPFITGFGIATGIAIMLLSFGPSVLFLYKKRLNQYKRHEGPNQEIIN